MTTAPTLHASVTAIRWPGLVPVGRVARRTLRGALIWGAVFALLVWELVNEFTKEYPTAADRARLVKTMGSDVGSQAIFGPAHHLDTVAGYTAYHVIAVFGLIGAVWGLLAGTRLLRGEEDAGRWEALLVGPTTRRRAAAALAGLGLGLLALWAVAATATLAFGRLADPPFTLTASLFTALAGVAGAAMFLAVGALCSQLAATRRQAAELAAGVFGFAYVIRVVAYSGTALRWLHWVTPLGWVDELRPLTNSRPLALLPIVGLTAALASITVVLAGTRDLGAGILPTNDTAPPHTRLLHSPLGLAARLELHTALGWTIGLGAGGLVLGLSTKTVQGIWKDQTGGVVQRLGGASGGDAYLGLIFLIVALLVGLAAAGQVTATREEEADGRLDHLLARPGIDGAELTAATEAVAEPLVGLMEPTVAYFHRKAWERSQREDLLVHMVQDAAPPGDVPGEIAATILFVDLSGFTPLTEAMGDAAAAALMERFSGLVRRAALEHNGTVVKQIGDEFMLAFTEPAAAVACGLDIEAAASAEEQFPAVRQGAHAGRVLYRVGDYVGSTVNVAARVVAEADRHQFLITGAVRDGAGDHGDATFSGAGTRLLRGIAERVELFEVVPTSARPARAIDPVCLMELDPSTCLTQLTWRGAQVHFCSEACLARFVAAPDQYSHDPK